MALVMKPEWEGSENIKDSIINTCSKFSITVSLIQLLYLVISTSITFLNGFGFNFVTGFKFN